MSSSAAVASVIPDREALILDNQGLIGSVANRLRYRMHGSMTQEDLFSAGQIGLVDAADTFDASRGCKFSTHATWRIYGAITRYLDCSTFPKRQTLNKYLRLDPDFRLVMFHSLDPELHDDPTGKETAPLDAVADGEFFRLVVRGLPEQMKRVILLRYVEGLNFREIGEIIGLTTQGAQRSHRTALETIRKHPCVRQYQELAT